MTVVYIGPSYVKIGCPVDTNAETVIETVLVTSYTGLESQTTVDEVVQAVVKQLAFVAVAPAASADVNVKL